MGQTAGHNNKTLRSILRNVLLRLLMDNYPEPPAGGFRRFYNDLNSCSICIDLSFHQNSAVRPVVSPHHQMKKEIKKTHRIKGCLLV